ncbi:hypothetical protein D1818_21785 [Aquimarina sp. BL5]|uniref:hypothetical protein n=1 Tax=Aquimarina sp. BL5 TaxID=1714860 RepID=UPI000E4BE5E2|nr:hypothetical protein [Aquimarina sp. BL5]AXT53328.1 hypothetical protein D1818_21785 [Aquimarina sp. BL5]RKN02749.1 hypothetical protein D7036_15900 [Aquimarina sp. BL5]
MKIISNDTLIKKYDLNLGTYYFYDQYIIAEIKEGEVITLGKLHDLIPIVQKHYGNDQPFTYISDRINSHSIIPTDYLDCPLIYMDNFKGYGVVTYNSISTMSTEIEKHFAKRPFYNFQDLKDAIEWTKKEAIK